MNRLACFLVLLFGCDLKQNLGAFPDGGTDMAGPRPGADLAGPPGVDGATGDAGPRPTAWLTAELVDTGDSPQVAMDSMGNGLVVWRKDSGSASYVMARHYVAGSGWATSVSPHPTDSRVARAPLVTTTPAGDSIVVWTQTISPNPEMTYYSAWTNRYHPGAGWGTAQALANDPAQMTPTSPLVSVDSTGKGVATWTNASAKTIFSAYLPGTGWTTSQPVGTMASGFASLASSATGATFGVVSTFQSVLASSYDGTSWSSDTPLYAGTDTVNVGNVATDANGNAMVVWEESPGPTTSSFRVWACRYVHGSGWETPLPIGADNGAERTPYVAMDAAGNATVTWQLQPPGTLDFAIWGNHYSVATGWDTAVMLNTSAPGAQVVSNNVAMGGGDAMAVWEQVGSGAQSKAWARRYVSGTGWDAGPSLIPRTATGYARVPSVAMDPNGRAIAVWTEDSSTVWAARFQ